MAPKPLDWPPRLGWSGPVENNTNSQNREISKFSTQTSVLKKIESIQCTFNTTKSPQKIHIAHRKSFKIISLGSQEYDGNHEEAKVYYTKSYHFRFAILVTRARRNEQRTINFRVRLAQWQRECLNTTKSRVQFPQMTSLFFVCEIEFFLVVME